MEERVVLDTDTFEAFVTDTKSSTVTSEMDPQMEPVYLKFLFISAEHFRNMSVQELIKWQKWDQQHLL